MKLKPGDIYLDPHGRFDTSGTYTPQVYIVCCCNGEMLEGFYEKPERLWECIELWWGYRMKRGEHKKIYRGFGMQSGSGPCPDEHTKLTVREFEGWILIGNLWDMLDPLVEKKLKPSITSRIINGLKKFKLEIFNNTSIGKQEN